VIMVAWESGRFYLHLARRRKIRTVINVNGTRGKSSVARLLAFALKEAGYKVMAKTTGTIPQIITVDGKVEEIKRGDYPNINEQMDTVGKAARSGAEVLVAECMAVDPNYQKVAEEKMLMSDIGIITNARTDHREVMGSTVEEIAIALCNSIPRRQVVFTAERKHFSIIEKKAKRKGSRAVLSRDPSFITDEMMKPFPFLEQRENVALVLEVCKHLGVSEEMALRGMYKTIPDPGILTSIKFAHQNKWFEFINAFSVNDPDSLITIWERMTKGLPEDLTKMILFNARSDRPIRSIDTGAAFAGLPVDVFLVTGQAGDIFQRALVKGGVPRDRIVHLGMARPKKTFEICCAKASEKNFVFCAGNIKDRGMEFIEFVEKMESSI